MKKCFLLYALILLTSFQTFAQEQTIDAKANTILQTLDKKYNAYKTIKADFTITISGKGASPEVQKATLWVKGGKYKLEIINQIVFCDSTTTWTYLKDAQEVHINNVDPGSDKGSLSLTTIFKIYEKGYKSHFVNEETLNNIVTEEIDLYPKHPEKEKFHTIRLYIDKAKNQLISIKMMMKDGTTQLYTMGKFVPNSIIPDASFKFDPKNYPGVNVEDLR